MKNIMLFLMTLLMSSHVMAQESIVTGILLLMLTMVLH